MLKADRIPSPLTAWVISCITPCPQKNSESGRVDEGGTPGTSNMHNGRKDTHAERDTFCQRRDSVRGPVQDTPTGDPQDAGEREPEGNHVPL